MVAHTAAASSKANAHFRHTA